MADRIEEKKEEPLTVMEMEEMKMALRTAEATAEAKSKVISSLREKVRSLEAERSAGRAPLVTQIQSLQEKNKDLEIANKQADAKADHAEAKARASDELADLVSKELEETSACLTDLEKRLDNDHRLYSLCEMHARKKKPVENCRCPVCKFNGFLINEREKHFQAVKELNQANTKVRTLERKLSRAQQGARRR